MAAPINAAYIEVRYSGGASNTTALSSIGGAMSTVSGGIVLSKAVSLTGSIGGVTVDDAPGSANGAGTLTYTASTDSITWAGYGSSAGVAVSLATGDGKYSVTDASSGAVFITVVHASLPGSTTSCTVTVSAQTTKIFDDVTPSESLAGENAYRALYITNAHSTGTAYNCKPYIYLDPVGADSLALGLNEAVDATAQTLANETTAPSSVTFSTPAQGAMDMGQLNSGQKRVLWVRRAIPTSTVTPTPLDYFSIQIDATVG